MILTQFDSPPIKKPTLTSRVMVEATGISVVLEAEEHADSGIRISGQLIVPELELPIWFDALVELWEDERLKRFTVVDDKGAFECNAEYIGNIRLVVINRDEQVVMFNDINFP